MVMLKGIFVKSLTPARLCHGQLNLLARELTNAIVVHQVKQPTCQFLILLFLLVNFTFQESYLFLGMVGGNFLVELLINLILSPVIVQIIHLTWDKKRRVIRETALRNSRFHQKTGMEVLNTLNIIQLLV